MPDYSVTRKLEASAASFSFVEGLQHLFVRMGLTTPPTSAVPTISEGRKAVSC